MKKKIISFCTILCLIFPCFFAVACKENVESEEVKAYTYSVTLKNAKGKIDESGLADEYDYASEKNIDWEEDDGDYTLSVTRTTALSGKVVVSLLEGYDYSNLSLTVNGEDVDYAISSGDNFNCADDAYLADRQFSYEYSKMKNDTSLVVDFTNCNLAKITLDVTNLKSNNVKYYVVEDDFVTLEQAQNQASSNFTTFTENELVVDYGSIVAFDYSEQLVLNNDEFDKPQTFNYATSGSMYFTSSNRVQYLEAQKSGKCEVYSIISDTSKNGTVRVLSSSGLSFANSLENLQENNFDTVTQEYEYYDGEMFNISVYKADIAFIELDEDAQNFNYYLVSKLDETIGLGNIVETKTIEDTEKKYLELDLSDTNSAKYLVRKPSKTSQYFIVYATGMRENTRFANADAVLIGSNNKPSNIPTAVTDTVLYYFAIEKEVQVSIPSLLTNKKSNVGQLIENVTISAKNINDSTGSAIRSVDPVSVNPSSYASMEVDCYLEEDETRLYRFDFTYSIGMFDEATFTVSAENLHLYDGEVVYYSTTPSVGNSWTKLDTSTSLELTSGDGSAVYYYVLSDRADADIKIVDALSENISESNRYHDCFGRMLFGCVSVDGRAIDLTKIKCLEIVSGYYSYNQKVAHIVRNFDETSHNISLENAPVSSIMISLDGGCDLDDFISLDELGELTIKYSELNNKGEIYYYVNSDVNEYLVLKDFEGNVVSDTKLVYTSGYVEMVNYNYVYSLSLNGDYYAEDAEFTIDVIEVSYNLYDENENKLRVYTSNDRLNYTEELYVNTSYFVTCEDDYRIDIYDEYGVKLVDWSTFIHISYLENLQSIYLFTFKFPAFANYEPGTKFILVKTAD